jgi:hypothetical protein
MREGGEEEGRGRREGGREGRRMEKEIEIGEERRVWVILERGESKRWVMLLCLHGLTV